MTPPIIEIKGARCIKCGYEWAARKENPKACPKCKSRQDKQKQTVEEKKVVIPAEEFLK